MFEIYSSNADLVTETLKSSAMFMGDSDFRYFILGGFLLGIIMMIYLSILGKGGEGSSNIKLMTMAVVIIMALLIPKTQVVVVDRFKGYQNGVDNVPLGVAIIGWLTSAVGSYLDGNYSVNYSSVSGDRDKGFLSSVYLITLLRDIQLVGDTYATDNKVAKIVDDNLNSYIRNCYFSDYISDEDKMMNGGWLFDTSKQPLAVLQDISHATPFSRYTSPTSETKTTVSCFEFRDNIVADLQNQDFKTSLRVALFNKYEGFKNESATLPRHIDPESPEFTEWLNNRLNEVFSGGSYTIDLEGGTSGQSGDSTSLQNIDSLLLTSYLAYKLREQNYRFYLNDVSDRKLYHALKDSLNQRYLQFTAESNQFQEMSIPVMMFIEMLVFALTPFAMFMIALGIGIKIVGMYIKMLIWIQLWPVSLTLANFYIESQFMQKIQAFTSEAGGTLTIGNLDRLYMETGAIIGTGNMWISMVPILTLFILSGSMYVFTQMASRMQGADTFNEKRISPDQIDASPVIQTQGSFAGTAVGINGELGGNTMDATMAQMQAQMGNGFKAAVSNAEQNVQAAQQQYQNASKNIAGAAFSNDSVSATQLGFAEKDSKSTQQIAQTAVSQAMQTSEGKTLSEGRTEQFQTALKAALGADAGAGLDFGALSAKLSTKAGMDEVVQSMKSQGFSEDLTRQMMDSVVKSDNFQRAFADLSEWSDAKTDSDAFKTSVSTADQKELTHAISELESSQETLAKAKSMDSALSTGSNGNLAEMARTMIANDGNSGRLNALLNSNQDRIADYRDQVLAHFPQMGNAENKQVLDTMGLMMAASQDANLAQSVLNNSGFNPHSSGAVEVGSGYQGNGATQQVTDGLADHDAGNITRNDVTAAQGSIADDIVAGHGQVLDGRKEQLESMTSSYLNVQNGMASAEDRLRVDNLNNALSNNALIQSAESFIGPSSVVSDYKEAAAAYSNDRSAENATAFYSAALNLSDAVAEKASGEAVNNFIDSKFSNDEVRNEVKSLHAEASEQLENGQYLDALQTWGKMVVTGGGAISAHTGMTQAVREVEHSGGDYSSFNRNEFSNAVYEGFLDQKNAGIEGFSSVGDDDLRARAELFTEGMEMTLKGHGAGDLSPEAFSALTSDYNTVVSRDGFDMASFFSDSHLSTASTYANAVPEPYQESTRDRVNDEILTGVRERIIDGLDNLSSTEHKLEIKGTQTGKDALDLAHEDNPYIPKKQYDPSGG